MKAALAFAAIAATASASAIAPRAGKGGHGHGTKCKHKPLVSPERLQGCIQEDALREGAEALEGFAYAYPERNRLTGGNGHNDTVKYLVETLEGLDGYYSVSTQAFTYVVQANGTANLSINGETNEFGMFDYSTSGTVTAPLVVVGNLGCESADFPAEVSGNIALISRGTCPFGNKSALAGQAGAAGAIIYDNLPGGPIEGTLGTPPNPIGDYVPTLGLSQAQGLELVEQINGGATIEASMFVETVIENRTMNNVIATTNCGNANTTLVLGAHTDSVAAGPGINDDGSGTIGILEVAKQLVKYKVNNAVTFGFWAGEEEGLLGSTYFVEHQTPEGLATIRAYLNFDMIASPNYVHAIYDGDGSSFNETGPAGSSEIEAFFESYFASAGENFTSTAFDGRSDYLAFIENGIPAGGTFTGAEDIKTEEEVAQFGGTAGESYDPNYHEAGDNVANLNFDAFVLHAKAIAASVATYATSFESLPPKAPLEKRGVAASLGRSRLRRGGRKGKKAAL